MRKVLAFIIAILLLSPLSAVAVSIGNSAQSSGTGDLSFAHTHNGDMLLVFTEAFSAGSCGIDTAGVTYNGVAMTELTAVQPDIQARAELWYLLNPASGSNTVAVDYDTGCGPGSPETGAVSVSVSGVSTSSATSWYDVFDEATQFDGSATGPSSISLTTSVSSTIIGITAVNGSGAITPDASDTEVQEHEGGNGRFNVSWDNFNSATTDGLSWAYTNNSWRSMIAVALKDPAAAGGGASASTMRVIWWFDE